MKRLLIFVLAAVMAMPLQAAAQAHENLWRGVAAKIDVGTEVSVRLRDGRKLRATLLEAREDRVLLQPRTRVAVPVQEVPYSTIVSLERRTQGGMSAGKAIGIGIASGAGALLAVFAILAAAYSD